MLPRLALKGTTMPKKFTRPTSACLPPVAAFVSAFTSNPTCTLPDGQSVPLPWTGALMQVHAPVQAGQAHGGPAAP